RGDQQMARPTAAHLPAQAGKVLNRQFAFRPEALAAAIAYSVSERRAIVGQLRLALTALTFISSGEVDLRACPRPRLGPAEAFGGHRSAPRQASRRAVGPRNLAGNCRKFLGKHGLSGVGRVKYGKHEIRKP